MPRKRFPVHLTAVAVLGCIVCGRHAEVHHLRTGVGMGQRSSDYLAIPLCPDHHRNGGYGVAFHAGRKGFERNFGNEVELLEETYIRLRSQGHDCGCVEQLETEAVWQKKSET